MSDIEETVNFLELTVKTDTNLAAYKKLFPLQSYSNIDELLGLCEKVNSGYSGQTQSAAQPSGIPGTAKLFVKNNCGFSRAVMLARENLHLVESVSVSNISENSSAKEELTKLTGKDQAPCLVVNDKPMHESAEIVGFMVSHSAPLL